MNNCERCEGRTWEQLCDTLMAHSVATEEAEEWLAQFFRGELTGNQLADKLNNTFKTMSEVLNEVVDKTMNTEEVSDKVSDELFVAIKELETTFNDSVETAATMSSTFLKAFFTAGAALEDISKNSNSPEDRAKGTKALEDIRAILNKIPGV